MTREAEVAEHYSRAGVLETVLDRVRAVAPDPDALTVDDLAPVDEFHVGGREASENFLPKLGLLSEHTVLDVGCGIGGAARFVAARYGSTVRGVDLTPEFCSAAELLTHEVGLGDKVSIHCASALDLPFADGSFDAAYTMHVGMNIEDKPALFAEVARVLPPGARFGIYDILATSSGVELDYPVPWASGPETSFLATLDEMRGALDGAGFDVGAVEDRTAFARDFFAKLKAQAEEGVPALGLHLIMGEDFPEKARNMAANVMGDLCGPWEIVCTKR